MEFETEKTTCEYIIRALEETYNEIERQITNSYPHYQVGLKCALIVVEFKIKKYKTLLKYMNDTNKGGLLDD